MRSNRNEEALLPARGEGFFAAAETESYKPSGSIVGQMTPDSCVAACCRMLLRDYAEDAVETHLRIALGTDEKGSPVSKAPSVLRDFGLPVVYVFYQKLTIEELAKAVKFNPAIVKVRTVLAEGWHAILVDSVDDESVTIRDPLPEAMGTAYKVSLEIFVGAWITPETGCGQAAIAVE